MSKQCCSCKLIFESINFYKNARRRDGLSSYCKTCDDNHNKQTRLKNPEKNSQHRRNYRNRIRELYHEWKKDKACVVCGENDPCCFDLHHVDMSTKEDDPSKIIQNRGWEAFLKEAEKCILVCSNCHRKIHAGHINTPALRVLYL